MSEPDAIPQMVLDALMVIQNHYRETRPWPEPEPEEGYPVPALSFAVGEYGSRWHLDAHFARLSFAVLDQADSFEVRDFRSQLLGIWKREHFDQVLNALGKLNSELPGAATYVMLNDDSVIRQWKLNVAHHSREHREQRVDDLPGMAEGKKAKTAGLMDELLESLS